MQKKEREKRIKTPEDVCLQIEGKLQALLNAIYQRGEYFEFGADTHFVQRTLQHVKNTIQITLQLEEFYSLEKVSLKIANKYYLLLGTLDVLQKTVETILRSQYGKTENTQKVIENIQGCLAALSAISGREIEPEFEDFG